MDSGYIGIDKNRLKHMLAVGKLVEDICRNILLWDENKCREMFALGYLHDIGYEFSEEQPEHPDEGGKILKNSGYKYWQEVYWHGKPSPKYVSDELMVLNLADLRIGRNGETISVLDRLDDIGERYGFDSIQYLREPISTWHEGVATSGKASVQRTTLNTVVNQSGAYAEIFSSGACVGSR